MDTYVFFFSFHSSYEILHAGPLKTSIVFYVYLITVKSSKTPAERIEKD